MTITYNEDEGHEFSHTFGFLESFPNCITEEVDNQNSETKKS